MFPLAKASATTPATLTSDTDRIISIFVTLPKVAKASTIVTVASHCRQNFFSFKTLPTCTSLNGLFSYGPQMSDKGGSGWQ
jgi:hypothetical protein